MTVLYHPDDAVEFSGLTIFRPYNIVKDKEKI